MMLGFCFHNLPQKQIIKNLYFKYLFIRYWYIHLSVDIFPKCFESILEISYRSRDLEAMCLLDLQLLVSREGNSFCESLFLMGGRLSLCVTLHHIKRHAGTRSITFIISGAYWDLWSIKFNIVCLQDQSAVLFNRPQSEWNYIGFSKALTYNSQGKMGKHLCESHLDMQIFCKLRKV